MNKLRTGDEVIAISEKIRDDRIFKFISKDKCIVMGLN